MNIRTIRKTYPGTRVLEGAGVRLTRIFSQPDVNELDPFLLLDFFDSSDAVDYIKGFPWHPHRGIETITYLIEGEIEHGDSLGNSGVIQPHGCQWMTAGRGILHQEMPKPGEYLLGTQLWLNLPRADKMTEPAYRDITENDLALVEKDDSLVRVIAGTYSGKRGPVRGTYVDPLYLDITLKSQAKFEMDVPTSDTVFLFLLAGGITFPGGQRAESPAVRGILLSDGEQVGIESEKGARFLMIAGRRLNEPIAWGGPIVMNTQDELQQAFSQLRNNTFIQR